MTAFVGKVTAAGPYADSVRLVHDKLPLWDAEQGFTDHDVFAAVVDGFGCLSHRDRDHAKTYDNEDFPAESGLALEQFTAALVEFLHTAKRPTNVRWAV
ncbi:Imm1 family immunity protein [Saccharomonospora xinjiangensis]|uniref:Imm1 family immunity protein n=1 Tax=Saccharomonospora xinjiangensis TaxID=75294 RepID=UPI001FFCE88B